MTFGLFLPSNHPYNNNAPKDDNINIPVLFWLSGLTCTDTNFAMKAGPIAFECAEKNKMAIVMPDTSPRGTDEIPNDPSYDLGIGAGFYVNATQSPWSAYFQMYTYITEELPSLLQSEFGLVRKSITGHSMGGHGALTIAFRDPKSWISVSAIAPISNPTNCPWGKKAFENYLGSVSAGNEHDATLLLKGRGAFKEYDDILIDQGLGDEFLSGGQLQPEQLEKAAGSVGQKLRVRRHEGFDHSYYFIAAFIRDHIEFHAERLNA